MRHGIVIAGQAVALIAVLTGVPRAVRAREMCLANPAVPPTPDPGLDLLSTDVQRLSRNCQGAAGALLGLPAPRTLPDPSSIDCAKTDAQTWMALADNAIGLRGIAFSTDTGLRAATGIGSRAPTAGNSTGSTPPRAPRRRWAT